MTTHPLPAGTWQLDLEATTVTVSAKMFMLLTVPATLTLTSGTVEIDSTGEVVSVEMIAGAASYASKSAKRNEHVTNADFLDAGNHPTIVFRSTDVARSASGYTADGTVTLKGQTAPFAVKISNVSATESAASFTATATVNRRAVGVDKMPSVIIGDQLVVSVEANAVPA